MPDQQTQTNLSDDLDEILVKEPDGTFRVVKVQSGQAPITKPGVVAGQAPQQKPAVATLPRVEKPAPATMVLGDEEAKELAAVTEKTKTIAPQMDDKSAEIARRAIAASGVVLSDPSLANRLQSVLVAAVKEVRKELETRDLLMRPKEQGGLGMTMNEAMRLLALLKPGAQQLVTPPSVTKPMQPPPVLQAPPIPKPIAPPPPPPSKPVVPSSVVVSKPVIPPPAPKPLPSPPITNQGVVTGQAPPPKPTPPVQEATRPPAPTKPVVQDVSFTPKLVGPIDELAMHLSEWRRMAPTVKDRGTKIEEKLRLLEEESYADRLKGVAAWYASDVVRLYQDVGRESLAAGKPVAAILADREAKGLPTLTLEEFQSVAELNERLRF